MELPGGSVSFLFTDIEGSTALWEQHPDAMRRALVRHDALLRDCFARNRGHVFKTIGDAFYVSFSSPLDAVTAAYEAQRALTAETWGETGPLRVRMAVHTGMAESRDGDYFGPPLNRAARLLSAAHGGQTLLSRSTGEALESALPDGISLLSLGPHRFKDLQQPELVYQLADATRPAVFPPLRSLGAFSHNLPTQLTSFIGREREMAEVMRLLASSRLLTITGTGGVGKTRLALQVSAGLVEEYAAGVWLVELAALADPSLVPQTAASALGVREEPGRSITATMIDHLKLRDLLLVLDNCEHLLQACATLADDLLRGCPSLRILATSRAPLAVDGETSWSIPSLSLPGSGEWAIVDAKWSKADGRNPVPTPPTINHVLSTGSPKAESILQYEAARLFVERAQTHLPSFSVTNENVTGIAHLCRQLEGIPLAIELAAARVRVLSVGQIAARLDDRFRLLAGGSRAALPRHQTLRAAIDWSYDLLSEAERALLRRLSVFAGGFTLEAAEAVCSDEGVGNEVLVAGNAESGPIPALEEWQVLDLLTQLIDRSLVVAEERDGATRYRLLETIRQYAREKLDTSGEATRVRPHHFEFYVGLAEQGEAELNGPEQQSWQARLSTEHDNLRAALEWSLHAAADFGVRLAGMLCQFWEIYGHFAEGRDWIGRVLEQGRTAAPAWRARALAGVARLAWFQGDFPAQRRLLEESLEIYRALDDPRGRSAVLSQLGLVMALQGEEERGRSLAEESLAIRRASPSAVRTELVEPLITAGVVAVCQGDFPAALAFNAESLQICQEVGDRRGVAASLQNIGLALNFGGDSVAAREPLERSLEIYRDLEDQWGIARSLYGLAHVARDLGDFANARSTYDECLRMTVGFHNEWGIVHALDGYGHLAVAQEQWERAARILAAVEALSRAARSPLPASHLCVYTRNVASARRALGNEAFAIAWAEGQRMTSAEAIRFVLDEAELAPS